jgi:hypothetical protein
MAALRRNAVLVLALALLTVLPAFFPAKSADVAARTDGSGWTEYTGELPSWARTAVAQVRATRNAAARPASLAQDETDIFTQDFEGVFPPPDWQVFDRLADTDPGVAHPVWDATDCTAPPQPAGNTRSAGAVAGGIPIGCDDPYSSMVGTAMFAPRIDGRNFDGGVEMTMWWKFHMRDNENFVFCTFWGEGDEDLQCLAPTATETDWIQAQPALFAAASNKEALDVAFFFFDDTPSGTNLGAWIDNILLVGLGTPRPTSTPGPTIQVPTPIRDTRPAYMPLSFKQAALDALPPVTGLESGINILFGSKRDANGNVVDRRDTQQYGIWRLCQQAQWYGMAPGAVVKLQWYFGAPGDEPAAIAEENTNINPEFTIQAPDGRNPVGCVQNTEDGRPVPINLGTWVVKAYVDGATEPAAMSQIVVQEDPPAGATARATQPAPTPSPTAPAPDGCTNTLINGGFEAGPNQGWDVGSNLADPNSRDLERVITVGPPTLDGIFKALLWGGARSPEATDPSAVHTLLQIVDHFDPSQLVSARLTAFFGIATTEIMGDAVENDRLIAAWLNPADTSQFAVVMNATDDDLEPNTWYRLQETNATTAALRVQPGWNQSALLFQLVQNATEQTRVVFDAIELRVCTTGAASAAGPAAPALDSAHGVALGDVPASGSASITPLYDRPWPAELTGGGTMAVEPAH